jgi:succinylglutamate desuccinylase
LVVVGGIHGNEPAGVHAARRVMAALKRLDPPFRGELVTLVGNRQALAHDSRFLGIDLNRQWTRERLAALEEPRPGEGKSPEEAEQHDLMAELRAAEARARADVFFLDLHTSSADGPPFLTIGDTLRHRAFARHFPLPVVLGLEDMVDGALLEHMNTRGHITLGVEGGRHDDPRAIDLHESVVWLALAAAGLMRFEDVPEGDARRRMLQEASQGIPPIIEVRYRRVVRPGDGFRMEPGYSNLQAVPKGRLLAHDRTGTIETKEDGLILLPLYQGQGDDGYFWCREVKQFWLRLSILLRNLHLGSLMWLLPGVRRHPSLPRTLIVDTRVARFYPLELFHLVGFRKRRKHGAILLVSRRPFDLRAPKRRAAGPS